MRVLMVGRVCRQSRGKVHVALRMKAQGDALGKAGACARQKNKSTERLERFASRPIDLTPRLNKNPDRGA